MQRLDDTIFGHVARAAQQIFLSTAAVFDVADRAAQCADHVAQSADFMILGGPSVALP